MTDDPYSLLVGKRVKATYRDESKEGVVRGTLLGYDDHTVIIQGERDGKPVVIGKATLIMLRIDEP